MIKIYDLLKVGKANAIHSVELERMTGFNNDTIKTMVQAERNEGKPICSGVAGYYIAGSEKELKETIGTIMAQGLKRLDTARALQRTCDLIYTEQITMQEYTERGGLNG